MKLYWLGLLVLLSGCASDFNKVNLQEDLSYRLMAPPESLWNQQFLHLVKVQQGDKEQRFLAQLEYQQRKMSLVALSTAGIPLFDLVWQAGRSSKVQHYVQIPGIDIKQIVSDIQWVMLPIELLQQGVSVPAVVTEASRFENDEWRRELHHRGALVMVVEKEQNKYRLLNVVKNYRLEITDLTLEAK